MISLFDHREQYFPIEMRASLRNHHQSLLIHLFLLFIMCSRYSFVLFGNFICVYTQDSNLYSTPLSMYNVEWHHSVSICVSHFYFGRTIEFPRSYYQIFSNDPNRQISQKWIPKLIASLINRKTNKTNTDHFCVDINLRSGQIYR